MDREGEEVRQLMWRQEPLRPTAVLARLSLSSEQ